MTQRREEEAGPDELCGTVLPLPQDRKDAGVRLNGPAVAILDPKIQLQYSCNKSSRRGRTSPDTVAVHQRLAAF